MTQFPYDLRPVPDPLWEEIVNTLVWFVLEYFLGNLSQTQLSKKQKKKTLAC